jgi:hypothetical protein
MNLDGPWCKDGWIRRLTPSKYSRLAILTGPRPWLPRRSRRDRRCERLSMRRVAYSSISDGFTFLGPDIPDCLGRYRVRVWVVPLTWLVELWLSCSLPTMYWEDSSRSMVAVSAKDTAMYSTLRRIASHGRIWSWGIRTSSSGVCLETSRNSMAAIDGKGGKPKCDRWPATGDILFIRRYGRRVHRSASDIGERYRWQSCTDCISERMLNHSSKLMRTIIVVDYDPVWPEVFSSYSRKFGLLSVTSLCI